MEYLPTFLDNKKLKDSLRSNETSKVYRAVKVMVEIGLPLNKIVTDDFVVTIRVCVRNIHDNLLSQEFKELGYLLRHVKIDLIVVDSLLDLFISRRISGMNLNDFDTNDLEFLLAILHQIKVKHEMEFTDKVDEIFRYLIKHNLFSSLTESKHLIYHSLLPYFLEPYNEDRLKQILDMNRLDVICALHKYFILKDYQLPGLWSQIQAALRQPQQRKNAVFLLKCRIQLSGAPEDDSLFQQPNSMHYDNLIQLLEASDAKQLHLLQPSMHLLHQLNELHLSWQVTAWIVYLSHPHLAVVEATLYSLLKENWWLQEDNASFEQMLPLVLRGFNLTSSLDIFRRGSTLFKNLGEQHMTIINQHSNNVAWTPTSFYYFHKELLPYITLNSISISSLLNRLQAVPDKCVRDTFMEVYFKPKILQYISCDKNGERALKDVFYAVFLHYYYGDSMKWLDQEYLSVISQSMKDSYNLQSIYQVTTVTYSYLQFLITIQIHKRNSEEFLKLSHKYLCETFSGEIVSEFGLDILHQAIIAPEPLFKDNTALSIDLETILMDITINFSTRSVALRIYSCLAPYFQTKREIILKLWTDMLLCGDYKFDENTCKAFLKLQKLTYQREDVCNIILSSQTDSVFIILFKYFTSDVEVSVLKQCCKKLIDMKRSTYFKRTCNAFFGELSSNCHLDLLETEYFHVLFKESLHVRYLITKKWADMNVFNDIRILKLAFENCLIGEAVRSKKEKMDFNIMMEILNNKYKDKKYEHLLHQWYCYKSQASILNTMIICYNFNIFDVLDICITHLDKRFQKRYYVDSQIHFEKVRIYQLLLFIYQKVADVMDEEAILKIIFKYLCEENNQNDVTQFQMLLLTNLKFYNTLLKYLGDGIMSKVTGGTNALTNIIPILYHIVRYSDAGKHCSNAIAILLNYAMGANFKLRLLSQISILYLLKNSSEVFCCDAWDKYGHICGALELTQIDINRNSNLKYLAFLNPIEHYTAETILFDIPRLNNVCEQEWRLYSQLIKEMLRLNKRQFCGLEFLNTNRCYSQLDTPEPKVNDKFDIQLTPSPSVTQPNNPVQRKPLTECMEYCEEGDRSSAPANCSGLVVIGSLVDSVANLGGLARTCHILGAATLVIHDSRSASAVEFQTLSMSAERWLNIQEVKVAKIGEYLQEMRNEGYAIIGAEQTNQSVLLSQHVFQYKTVLLLGNERTGIPADLLTMLDTCVEIPQYGVVRSLNVHVAAALIVYEYTQKIITLQK